MGKKINKLLPTIRGTLEFAARERETALQKREGARDESGGVGGGDEGRKTTVKNRRGEEEGRSEGNEEGRSEKRKEERKEGKKGRRSQERKRGTSDGRKEK